MRKYYIGIDNGVTGSIGIIGPENSFFHPTPTKRELSYTKKKAWIRRIDYNKLCDITKPFLNLVNETGELLAIIERPMVNPGRFVATLSAIRALETTLIALENQGIPLMYVDSKQWQSELLPRGVEGPEELKAASLVIGKRLFPNLQFKTDADSILIAEWARRNNL